MAFAAADVFARINAWGCSMHPCRFTRGWSGCSSQPSLLSPI